MSNLRSSADNQPLERSGLIHRVSALPKDVIYEFATTTTTTLTYQNTIATYPRLLLSILNFSQRIHDAISEDKFIENFDDDESDPPSPAPSASPPSPKRPSRPNIFSDALAERFSAMVLRTQPRAPTQAQAPGAAQGSESSAVAVETLVQRAVDAFDRLQEVNPEGSLEESSALVTEQGTSQHEQQEPSAKTANVFLHQLFDKVLEKQKVTPEEMRHSTKYIKESIQILEQDLEVFAEERLQISLELQKWFVIHKHDSDWETKTYCSKCLLLFEQIDELYFAAFSNVRDMMEVLEKGLRASALFYKSDDMPDSDFAQIQTLGEFCAPLLQHLESTERMLQALEDDAEDRKGWPQVYSSEEYSSMISQLEDDQDENPQSKSDQTKAKANAKSSAMYFSQVNKVFGNEVIPLAEVGHIIGKHNQVLFAINTIGDVSAQQWSKSDGQWFRIGHFSKFSKCIKGTLALHQLKDELAQCVPALPRNGLAYFKALARQHEASMMNIDFGLEQLQACLRNVSSNGTGQEVANTPADVGSTAQPQAEPVTAEMANEDQDAEIHDPKSQQVNSKKSKSKKQKKKGRR
ncbi:hypothetical protein KCU91_g13806, partial [Aureobasidium melanogenum]